jgi:hypothetical protein
VNNRHGIIVGLNNRYGIHKSTTFQLVEEMLKLTKDIFIAIFPSISIEERMYPKD